ncbi:MAG: hypothetical protein KGJ09_10300 [Candidatus Omnitrophica bacterium]|nr:hypothetical protein [Candidatus Omnitrophota bacterium]MDE2010446.1 hypothetical protein [Candidatus Omnitrophota bacterium]MDE2215363.1 hypothetical protein [Candidatus Omnitrophota bacterium]MDE2232319.1 hypothetical protein [Candidatus Omnitrophota bacterium]
MDTTGAWEKALRETEIIRSRIIGLQTFSETHVPYILLSPSEVNEGDTVVRTGEVLVHRPSLILPPHIPQLEGFDFEGDNSFNEDTMINFLLVRGISLPSMKYDNKVFSLNVFEGKIQDAVGTYGNRLQREENTATGLIRGPDQVWQLSLLIFVCSQIARNSSVDIRRLLDEYHKKKDQS